MDELEAFTCLMYGHAREKFVNAVRSIMLNKMVGENKKLTTKYKLDLSRLPPCRDSLAPHIGRVNYRLDNIVKTTALPTTNELIRRSSGIQFPTILARAGRRPRKVS